MGRERERVGEREGVGEMGEERERESCVSTHTHTHTLHTEDVLVFIMVAVMLLGAFSLGGGGETGCQSVAVVMESVGWQSHVHLHVCVCPALCVACLFGCFYRVVLAISGTPGAKASSWSRGRG